MPTIPTDEGHSDLANVSSQAPKNMHYALKSPNADMGCINSVCTEDMATDISCSTIRRYLQVCAVEITMPDVDPLPNRLTKSVYQVLLL